MYYLMTAEAAPLKTDQAGGPSRADLHPASTKQNRQQRQIKKAIKPPANTIWFCKGPRSDQGNQKKKKKLVFSPSYPLRASFSEPCCDAVGGVLCSGGYYVGVEQLLTRNYAK